MSETDFPSADDPQFDQYMEALAKAINYGQHQEPLRGYCAGLIEPGERKSMEPIAAGSGERFGDAPAGAPFRGGRGVERRGGAGGGARAGTSGNAAPRANPLLDRR